LSLKTKVDSLSVVCPQNHWDGFSWFGLKTGGDGFSQFVLKTDDFAFPGLGLKTSSYGLVILASKSLQQFLSLCLKTNWATIYRLHHKTDEWMKTARSTCRDLVACFAWKHVGIGFPSLILRLAYVRCGWCAWYHRGGCIEIKLKTDESMRQAASDSATLCCFHCIMP
jgi:hypothetical protein